MGHFLAAKENVLLIFLAVLEYTGVDFPSLPPILA